MGCSSWTSDQAGAGRRWSHAGRWRPVDIGLMVAGFAIYWPLGLAVLAVKCWQKSSGAEGNVVDFARGRWAEAAGWAESWRARTPRHEGFSRGTGNSAFDDWRTGELDRLEAERRKLAEAEREFAAFMDNLRRARDREEFDRFMRDRTSGAPQG